MSDAFPTTCLINFAI